MECHDSAISYIDDGKNVSVCKRDVRMDKGTLSVLIFSFMSIIVIIVNFFLLILALEINFVHYVYCSRGESILYCWL